MKSIKPEDLNLSEKQIKDLVEGAQKFMAPQQDPEDDETYVPKDALGREPGETNGN